MGLFSVKIFEINFILSNRYGYCGQPVRPKTTEKKKILCNVRKENKRRTFVICVARLISLIETYKGGHTYRICPSMFFINNIKVTK